MSQSLSHAGANTQTEKHSIADLYLVMLNPEVDFNGHMAWVQEEMRQHSDTRFQCEVVGKYERKYLLIHGYQAKLNSSAYEKLSQSEQVNSIIKEQFAELDD